MKRFVEKFKHPLVVVFLTVFIDLIGFGILIPVIPQLLTVPNSPFFLLPNGWKITQGEVLLGFLTASFPLAQFFATPILGQLSDKFGRKPILAISLAGTSLSYVIFAIGIITKNIPLLFAARIFDGITGGNIAVAQAAIADISTPQNRAKNFGLIGAAFGLGFVLGPYLGGKLSDHNFVSWFDATTPFWFAAILAAINVVSVLTVFPETHKTKNSEKQIQWTKSVYNIIHAFTFKSVLPLFITFFVFNAGFTFFTTFGSAFFQNPKGLNFTPGNVGDLYAYIGICIALTQIVITRLIAKKLKEYQVLYFSMFLTGISLAFIVLSNQWWHLLLIMPIMAVGNGLTFANITGLVSRSVDHKIQGEILGINSSVQALAQAIPAILSGFIAAYFSEDNPLNLFGWHLSSASVPIFISSLIIIFGGILYFFIYKAPKDLGESENIAPAH
jgi:DHA1 family tetracycline resistance protein-like MFS transporter